MLSTQKAQATRFLVGAIDFGTAYSGWAFSFQHEYESDPTVATVKNWHSGTGNLTTEKTPTVLLVKPDGKTFLAFGYEAETKYRYLIDKNEHMPYYYFKHFKMALMKELGQGLDRSLTLKDEMGKELLALDVFSMSIQFLKDDMMKIVDKRLTSICKPEEIHWVLTVPAIWSDAAKQFMREAALKAGISKECLTIALEPEATSLLCRHIPVGKVIDSTSQSIARLPTGSKYLVLDAGGGTIDITVHEVQSSHTLREVQAASGGDWGGRMVDKAFELFLISLVGKEVYEEFKATEREDWLDLFRDFECRKRETVLDSEGRISIHFPSSLSDLYRQKNNTSIAEYLPTSKHAGSVEFKRDKVKFSSDLFQSFFSDSVQKITEHLTFIRLDDVQTILMVGGYSESAFLHKAVREKFPDKQVVIPLGASSAVLRGALIFGHDPDTISERILKYTYGVCSLYDFNEKIHPELKRIHTDAGDMCDDIFSKIVGINETVKTNENQYNESYFTVYRRQAAISFSIYASKDDDPVFVDDDGCTWLGELRIDFDDPDDETGRDVSLSMMFGGTEIVAQAEDVKTGKKQIATINFLG